MGCEVWGSVFGVESLGFGFLGFRDEGSGFSVSGTLVLILVVRLSGLQGYLAHKKQRPPLGPP